MNASLRVELGERSYSIEIGPGLLQSLGRACSDLNLGAKVLLVTDSNVGPIYAADCEGALTEFGFDTRTAVLPAGEETKCEARLFELYDLALDHDMGRKSCVVALGGGVVGDIAGYMAASYLRGIPFVQLPTSLLAMVDSSVGGKTAINLPRGKNLVGAFHQPAAVLADVAVLATLPEREWRAGLAEVVKYGVIADAELFEYIEENAERLAAREEGAVAEIVRRSCEIKAGIVRRDERESGLRAILNFGHTLGHAVENAAGYGEYLHGEAVAVGMVYAAELSVRLAGMPRQDRDRIQGLLAKLGLPTDFPDFEWRDLYPIMRRDKKAEDGNPRFVLATQLGEARPGYSCSETLCEEVWNNG